MLENTKQKDEFLNNIQSCGDNWSEKIDIKIGSLEVKLGNNSDLSSDALNIASDKASELRMEWSEKTGVKYPDLEMPKRPFL